MNVSDNHRVQDLLRTVEQRHEEYLCSLRSLYETVPTTDAAAAASKTVPSIATAKSAAGAGSRTTSIAEVPSPPLRAHAFASDVLPSSSNTVSGGSGMGIPGRPRRLTLDAPPERPASLYPGSSPRPLQPVTTPLMRAAGVGGGGGSGVGIGVFEDDISFIPLLDLRHEHSGATTATRPLVSSSIDDVRAAGGGGGGGGGGGTRTLPQVRFSDDEFLAYLCDTTFTEEMSAVLEEMLRRRHELQTNNTEGGMGMSLREFAAFERESYVSSTFEAYEINGDGAATRMSIDADVSDVIKYTADMGPLEDVGDGVIDAPVVWDALKSVNTSGDAVGRITIVQEPTPLMLAALQLTMSPYFDMPELIYHLLSDKPNKGQTHAFMLRAFERVSTLDSQPSPPPPPPPSSPPHPAKPPLPPLSTTAQLRQRSFFFVFKYYTSVGEGLEPAPWQRYEKRPLDKKLADHIDIAECSSVLALSLGGDPVRSVRMRPRRERAREGFLYDALGAWHVLSIQSFPDDEHTVRGEEFVTQKSFGSGPFAFLELLISEYRDAGKRNLILHEKITKLITPPTEFMFDRRLRDKLLFEDKHFTYIRRYFWAYNTLAVINTGLAAMVAAYTNTFTPDFWSGSHPLLWPYPHSSSSSSSSAAAATTYRETLGPLRAELEKVVSDISTVLKRNERTRKEIENLRDQLFSGSAIKESRRAVDQGDNIQILTMISMIFLPLTFVTSVFGITEFTITPTNWRFAVTMVLVCVPFIALIVLLQTNGFTVLARRCRDGFRRAAAWYKGMRDGSGSVGGGGGGGGGGGMADKMQEREEGPSVGAQRRKRKRRLVAAASGRVAAARWRWKRPWRRARTTTMHVEEGIETGRI